MTRPSLTAVILNCVVITMMFAVGGCSEDPAAAAAAAAVANAPQGWSALGEGPPAVWSERRETPKEVHALFVDPKGYLYTGGDLEVVGKWDGTAWIPVPGEFMSVVHTFAMYDDGRDPAMYTVKAGDRYGMHLWRWNSQNQKWIIQDEPAKGILKDEPIEGEVLKLLSFEFGGKDVLLAGGMMTIKFPEDIDPRGGALFQWDGERWNTFANTGFDGGIGDMTLLDGDLVVAGSFRRLAVGRRQQTVNRIAVFDGGQWTALGSGIEGYTVEALAVVDQADGPVLYAAGQFESAGGQPARNIARWDGEKWQEVGGGIDGPVNALAVLETSAGPVLYAGGRFSNAGSTPANNIAAWDGQKWSALGEGVNEPVYALTTGLGKNLLYVGGAFTEAGGKPAKTVAQWKP